MYRILLCIIGFILLYILGTIVVSLVMTWLGNTGVVLSNCVRSVCVLLFVGEW